MGKGEAIITGEKVAGMVGSQYDAVLIAARRARELHAGWAPLIDNKTGAVVTALAEIEAGLVGREYLSKPQNISENEMRERKRQMRNKQSQF